MSEYKKDHTVEITVNSAEFTVPKGKISYATVVQLAFPGTPVTNAYIVKYTKGEHGNQSGVLAFGTEVNVKEGMNFRVAATGES